MEVVAEESLRALDAASFSISRWQRDREVLQTLINVGELGPGEALAGGRGPALADFQTVTDLLRRGEPYVSAIDDPRANPVGVALLRRLGKESEIAVPVIYEYVTWGELWATGSGGRRFGERDVRLLQAIAEQVAQAIGRAEQFGRVTRFAYEDPLTHLANRRLLDERLAGAGSEPDPAGLRRGRSQGGQRPRGHPAGDALLRGVAGALSLTASAFPQSLVARAAATSSCCCRAHSWRRPSASRAPPAVT